MRRFGNLVRPLAHSVLYPHQVCCNASPKAISGRTSYLRVRLAFHLYPHLIHVLFNALWFGPPQRFLSVSPWTWIGHPVSGLQQLTSALLRLAFASAPFFFELNLALCRNSLAHSTKGTPSHVRIVLRLFVSIWFQVLFTPLPGFFSPFPHGTVRYRSPGSI